jgi:hypothetical protein
LHCLVKVTLSCQPWFVNCVLRGAGGIAIAALLDHPKAASLLRLGGEKREEDASQGEDNQSSTGTRITIFAAHGTCHRQPVSTETMDLAASSATTMQMDSWKARKEWSWQAVGTHLVPSSIVQKSRRHHHHHKSWKDAATSSMILMYKGPLGPAPTVARLAE